MFSVYGWSHWRFLTETVGPELRPMCLYPHLKVRWRKEVHVWLLSQSDLNKSYEMARESNKRVLVFSCAWGRGMGLIFLWVFFEWVPPPPNPRSRPSCYVLPHRRGSRSRHTALLPIKLLVLPPRLGTGLPAPSWRGKEPGTGQCFSPQRRRLRLTQVKGTPRLPDHGPSPLLCPATTTCPERHVLGTLCLGFLDSIARGRFLIDRESRV